ncbi:hypothetical protein PACILC2_05520 [Paenibacillus cisolokensis]|uniref:Stage III sporulation protein D n=1 Tax=Paenibacillus cisolokensis TaxID=1658519 RepID=A0ABQ4N1D7_9BACL|nr:hypothetical protein PACILC2_05520 [Paenibacillus cisolokensis]
MHDYIKERTIKIGRCIVETKHTVRTIAKEFGVSKSTVHKDLTERLPEINPDLADQVKHILEYHKSIRHLRGGEATKIKYKKSNSKKREVIAAAKLIDYRRFEKRSFPFSGELIMLGIAMLLASFYDGV